MKKKDIMFILILLGIALLGLGGMTLAKWRAGGINFQQPSAEKPAAPAPETEKAAAPASETEEAPAPASETEEAPAPASETEEAAAPASETEEAPAPASETEEAPAPASETEKPGKEESASRDQTEKQADTEEGTASQDQPAASAATESEDSDRSKYGSIVISVAGEYFGDYSLGEDQVIEINDTNVVEIKDGQARMIHAECPDQLCTYMGPITGAYGLIVCLPNAVIVEGFAPAGTSGDDIQIDGLS